MVPDLRELPARSCASYIRVEPMATPDCKHVTYLIKISLYLSSRMSARNVNLKFSILSP